MRDGGWLRPVVAGVVVVALMAAAVADVGADHVYRAINSGIPSHWPKTGAEAGVAVVDSVASTASYDLDLPLRRANVRWKTDAT